jgi:hypothetical protein
MDKKHNPDRPKRIVARAKARIVKKFGIWVYRGDAADKSIPGLIDSDREDGQRQVRGAFRIRQPQERG